MVYERKTESSGFKAIYKADSLDRSLPFIKMVTTFRRDIPVMVNADGLVMAKVLGVWRVAGLIEITFCANDPAYPNGPGPAYLASVLRRGYAPGKTQGDIMRQLAKDHGCGAFLVVYNGLVDPATGEVTATDRLWIYNLTDQGWGAGYPEWVVLRPQDFERLLFKCQRECQERYAKAV